MSKPIELKVHFARDGETGRWYIAQSDVPGMRVEADSVQDLFRKVEDVAPDLIELNIDEILANHLPSADGIGSRRPAMSIRPVFDSPMAIAC